MWVEVEADYHQFFLAAIDVDPSTASGGGDLLDTSPNVVVIRTGIATGPVSVALSRLEAEPVGPVDQWEMVESAVVAVTAPLMVMTNYGDVSEDHQAVLPPATGWLGVRVAASGRSKQPDAIVDKSSERYLIEVWPTHAPNDPPQASLGVDGGRRQGDLYATDATVRRRGPVAWNPEA